MAMPLIPTPQWNSWPAVDGMGGKLKGAIPELGVDGGLASSQAHAIQRLHSNSTPLVRLDTVFESSLICPALLHS